MLSQLEQACKTYSTEFSCGLIEFDSDWQRIFVTALTFHLDQAIPLKHQHLSNQNKYTAHSDQSVNQEHKMIKLLRRLNEGTEPRTVPWGIIILTFDP